MLSYVILLINRSHFKPQVDSESINSAFPSTEFKRQLPAVSQSALFKLFNLFINMVYFFFKRGVFGGIWGKAFILQERQMGGALLKSF